MFGGHSNLCIMHGLLISAPQCTRIRAQCFDGGVTLQILQELGTKQTVEDSLYADRKEASAWLGAGVPIPYQAIAFSYKLITSSNNHNDYTVQVTPHLWSECQVRCLSCTLRWHRPR